MDKKKYYLACMNCDLDTLKQTYNAMLFSYKYSLETGNIKFNEIAKTKLSIVGYVMKRRIKNVKK